MPPEPDYYEQEPARTHRHYYRYDIKDWWCVEDATVTDYCAEYLDEQPERPTKPQ